MIEIPNPQSYMSIADWIELHIAITCDAITKAEISSLIEQITGQEPAEDLLSDLWNELSDRHGRYQNPSYVVEDRCVRSSRDMREAYEYISCLILSLFGCPPELKDGSKLFERISGMAIKEYLQGESFVFGWPVLDGTEIAIAERVKQVSTLLSEKFVQSPAARYKDRGLDVIAWKPFIKGRSSQCVILAQCASGKDWRQKTNDLPIASWEQYIHWACNPTTAFFVPSIIPDYLWHDVSNEAGILFDRIRILNLLHTGIQDEQLRSDLKDWVTDKLSEVSLN